MIQTRELRWFIDETLSMYEAWFNGFDADLSKASERVDLYLKLPHNNLGIKLREGRVEVKQRVSGPAEMFFDSRIGGFLESWQKYSFALDSADQESRQILTMSDTWIRVNKRRTGFKEGRDTSGHKYHVPISEVISSGIQYELSEIKVNGRSFNSVCIEEFGHHGVRIEESEILASLPPSAELVPASSQSYPQFLLDIIDNPR